MRANEINIFVMKVVFLAHKCFYKYDNEIQYPIHQFNDETFHSTHTLPFFIIFSLSHSLFSSLCDWICSSAPWAYLADLVRICYPKEAMFKAKKMSLGWWGLLEGTCFTHALSSPNSAKMRYFASRNVLGPFTSGSRDTSLRPSALDLCTLRKCFSWSNHAESWVLQISCRIHVIFRHKLTHWPCRMDAEPNHTDDIQLNGNHLLGIHRVKTEHEKKRRKYCAWRFQYGCEATWFIQNPSSAHLHPRLIVAQSIANTFTINN